jgi:kinetochore protein Fta7
MTAALHSVELLKAEIAKEEELLFQDQNQLEELQKNSKKEMKFWQEQAKKVWNPTGYASSHFNGFLQRPAIDLPLLTTEPDDSAEQIGFVSEEIRDSIFDIRDKDLQPIIYQLRNHLDSIRTNNTQVDGVCDAIREAGISLDSLTHQQSAD